MGLSESAASGARQVAYQRGGVIRCNAAEMSRLKANNKCAKCWVCAFVIEHDLLGAMARDHERRGNLDNVRKINEVLKLIEEDAPKATVDKFIANKRKRQNTC